MIKLLLLISFINLSLASEDRFLRVGEFTVMFKEVDGLWVNGSCEDRKCLAYTLGRRYKSTTVQEAGKNPSAVKCKRVLKGMVIITKDVAGNSQSVCAFPDHSYLI